MEFTQLQVIVIDLVGDHKLHEKVSSTLLRKREAEASWPSRAVKGAETQGRSS